MKASFTSDKITKNTVRFNQVLTPSLNTPVIPTVYVPKETLSALGWKEGAKLVMEVSVEAPAKKRGRSAAKAKAQAPAKAPAKTHAAKKAEAKA